MSNKMKFSGKETVIILLAGSAIFCFRFLMGLSKFFSFDSLQIYLIGLKSYTNGTFPYFGPDVVYTQTQIPGALQGLLVAGPFYLIPIPESPVFFLNLLTFAVLVFFGWYLAKRVPGVPAWFTYAWLLTSPWTLNYSTHIENPSYVIICSVPFFISIIELGKFYKSKILSPDLLFFLTGFSVFWIMQLHLSWILMIPYMIWICWINRDDLKMLLRGMVFLVIGAAISFSTLIPALLINVGTGGIENNLVFRIKNILEVPNIVLRFLMFASYEVSRFIGPDTPSRLGFLLEHKWVIPFAIFLLLTGFFQVGYFIWSFFRNYDQEEWGKVKRFTLISLLLLCFSFLFSVTEPRSHTFYILYPVAIWYSFYCYENLFKKNIKSVAVIFLFSGIIFHIALFIDRYDDESLFSNRALAVKAIHEKDYTFLGLRRESKLSLSRRGSLWTRSSIDGRTILYCDFEKADPCFVPQNLVKNVKFEGDYSCKIDSLQPFSITLIESLPGLNNPDKLQVSYWSKVTRPEEFLLVYEIRGEGGNTWKSHTVAPSGTNIDKWQFISFDLDLPAGSMSKPEIAIYFWMTGKSGAVLYIDNLMFAFSTGKVNPEGIGQKNP